MAFRAMLVIFRKPDLSPEAFKEHYENTHVPLLKSLAGDEFPKHIRNYVQRSSASNETGTQGPAFPASVIFGNQEDFPYDCLTICEWPSQAIFQAFRAKIVEKEAADKIAADEVNFLDKSKPQQVVLMDETIVSGPGA